MRRLPSTWVDDGLTMFPDSILGWNISPAGTCHDARYCTRLWYPGTMTKKRKDEADAQLGADVRHLLPFGLRWVGYAVFLGVWKAGHYAFDSCGYDAGERCRHGVAMPPWQARALRREQRRRERIERGY